MTAYKEQLRLAADEAYKLDVTQKLWADRATEAANDLRRAGYALAGLFVFVLAVIAILGWTGIIPVSSEAWGETPSEIAAHTVPRLIYISIPLVICFWAARLVVRYWSRSLLLQDDARARDTMLQTYRRMIEEKGAAPKEDRAIVLASIFRPIPGHGQDSVDPPNMTEFVNHFSPKP